MKPHERRSKQDYPYFKLAVWCVKSFTFRDGRIQFATEDDAKNAAEQPGKYRISRITLTGREDLAPFEVS